MAAAEAAWAAGSPHVGAATPTDPGAHAATAADEADEATEAGTVGGLDGDVGRPVSNAKAAWAVTDMKVDSIATEELKTKYDMIYLASCVIIKLYIKKISIIARHRKIPRSLK